MLAVLRQVGQIAAAGTRGDDDMLGLIDGLVALGVGHLDLMVGHNACAAHNDLDTVLLEQELHALAHRLCHTAAALHHSRKVGLGRLSGHAIVCSVVDIVVYLCRLQQRLGRNATPVEADATQVLAFHNSGFHTHLGSLDSSHIASRTAADNYYIVVHCSIFFICYS